MSASIPTAQNPTIPANQTANAASSSSLGSSNSVTAGAGSAPHSTKSPPIASSAAPPLVVGSQNGKASPVKPAVPTILNGSTAGDHKRSSSVTISAAGASGNLGNGSKTGITFGALQPSPKPATLNPHNPQMNPRVTSPAASPSPIPPPAQPALSGGRPSLPGQGSANLVFGGGNDNAESNGRPLSMPPQHLRRESSNSQQSQPDHSFANMRSNSSRGRGAFVPGYSAPGHPSPQPYRPRPNIPAQFQPGQYHGQPGSPYRQPAVMNSPRLSQQLPYGGYQQPPFQQPQQPMYGMPPHGPGMDPAYAYGYQMPYNAMPGSPARGHSFPHMHPQYPPANQYGQPPQAPSMARTPSNMSEQQRPSSAISATPMTNINSHTPQTQAPSSPAPSSTFSRPKKSAAVVIKNSEGEIVNFDTKKPSSSSGAAPAQAQSPAIVSTPTPPPRAPSAAGSSHSRAESTANKTNDEKRSQFLEDFKRQLAKEKEEEQAKAKAEAEKAKAAEEAKAKAAEEAKAAEAEKAAAEAKAAEEAAAEAKRKEEQEAEERWIAELEAQEAAEAEAEAAYQEKKKLEKAAAEAKAAEARAREDEELKRLEREAEELEQKKKGPVDEDAAKLFAGLKKNTMFGPGASLGDSGASTPPAEPIPQEPIRSAGKPKPAALKLETAKQASDPPVATPGMQSLKSARFLQVRDDLKYPAGILSPNPATNPGARNKNRIYSKDFLLQFQKVFSEKPSLDWDARLKETVGDSSEPPRSARTPGGGGMGMGNRQPSQSAARGPPAMGMGTFGNFGSARGTTSDQRYAASLANANAGGRPPMVNPLSGFVNGRPGSFMGAQGMNRQASFGPGSAQPSSPRVGSSRGKGSSKRGGDRKDARAEATMPLTAGMELKALEKSATGWKPMSQTATQASTLPNGHMAPDMVQRKVKAALNKMTPENFDKIADQILDIAGQSKDETDGRTLRQVIALTFEKACDEAHWASMYAKFAQRMLTTMSPEIKDETIKSKDGSPVVGGALFRKYLLNRCQEEFEKGWDVNLKTEEEGGEIKMLSDEYYVAAAAKRKGLGLIQFIGELYKLGMLTLRIMHECVLKLLDFSGEPDEGNIESLVKLLRTVGSTMSASEAGPKMISMYMERIQTLLDSKLPSRMHFMLLDVIDLWKKGWRDEKADAKGPKTIAEIHQEALKAQQAAEMERTRSNQRGGGRPPIGRGDARSFSGGGMMPPPDYPRDRVGMDDLRKLSKGASGRNTNAGPSSLGPSMLGSRSGSGRRGLGPGMMRGDDSGASTRTNTPPAQKEKESTTHTNSFSALAALGDASEGAGEVGSPPSTAGSPPASKTIPVRTKSPAVEAKGDGA